LAIVSWGSVFGPVSRAVEGLIADGHAVSHIHLRHLWPFPPNLEELLGGFDQILLPEMNMGQLARILRSEFLIDVTSLPKVSGRPFKVAEILDAAGELLQG
jgi:2-oxoglutarate ferredoxin oxidoreductase subunit alpha